MRGCGKVRGHLVTLRSVVRIEGRQLEHEEQLGGFGHRRRGVSVSM